MCESRREAARIVSYDHRIAEADSLPGIGAEEAEAIAVDLLASVGLDARSLERKEAVDKPRPKRMDRLFAWEVPKGRHGMSRKRAIDSRPR